MFIKLLTSRDQAERIVRAGGVSLDEDGSALVRDSFGGEYEVSQYGMCECGQRGCEHSLAASMTKATNAALEGMYASAGRAA